MFNEVEHIYHYIEIERARHYNLVIDMEADRDD